MLTALLLAALTYCSPVNFPISLAGNFGEPRPNHFHGGIDVRTELAVGKPIFSVADGYVERVTVGMYGFGNAVYVRHPNGTTSVYCHSKSFAPYLNRLVGHRLQLARQYADPIDVHLRPGQYPVAAGQLIAVSGNTGSSVAPHLHLEIHDTRTWAMMDPLDFLKQYLHDTTPPEAHAFKAYPMPGEGIFCGSSQNQVFGFPQADFSSVAGEGSVRRASLGRVFTAWGRVGFGIWADDYMEDTYHHYGIRRTELTVDGETVFYSDVDNIPVEHNRMVNSWGDYDHWRRHRTWYMKSFADPGNRLHILHTDDNRGIVCFDQERDYHLTYLLQDIYGNRAEYSFVVRGERQHIPSSPRQPQRGFALRWNGVSHLQMPGMQLVVPPQSLADDVLLQVTATTATNGLSPAFTFVASSACAPASTPCPLFSWAQLSIRVSRRVADPSQLCILCNGQPIGGTYRDGWLTAPVRELDATYQVGVMP